MNYIAKKFLLPELPGISKEQIEVHLALYEGYVKHTNAIIDTITRLKEEGAEKNAYVINELRRRLGFEFDGMRLHEYYFDQFEGGSKMLPAETTLEKLTDQKYGGFENFITHIKEVATTRGIGWVVVYHDPKGETLHTAFVNDHELGQLSGLPIIFVLDLWEHAFMVDYRPAQKKSYVDAVLQNINWEVVSSRVL